MGHDRGSSHGDSRIIRHVYQEHPSYVALLSRAYGGWRALAGEGLPPGAPTDPVMHVTGCLNASAPGGRAAHGHSCFDGAVAAAAEHGLPHEVLSAAAVNARFPMFSLPEGYQALLDPAGGYIEPEKAVRRLAAAAGAAGARMACAAPVVGWSAASSGGVEVTTASGEQYLARKLVLAPGAWLPSLVPQLRSVLTVERQVVGWFGNPSLDQIPHDLEPETRKYPVFLIDDAQGRYFYGFPAAADPTGLVKIGKYHHLRQKVQDPSALERSVTAEDEAALRHCLRYLPAVVAAPMVRAQACMFTNTPDGHFIVDVHPAHPNEVVIASVCSGHGFKFAPAVGEALAALAAGGANAVLPPEFAMHRLSPSRPGFGQAIHQLKGGT